MMWSTHSRRIDPISRSAKPFCQGEAGEVSLSRMTARVQALACPFAKTSLTRARRTSVDENEIDGLAALPG
jgi:hypothetical protein